MKKCLILLVLALSLAGCTNVDSEPTETTPAETVPAGYYVDGSELETKTNGAVRTYELPEGEYNWIAMAGDRVMLVSNGEAAQISMLSGMEGVPVAQLQLDSAVLETCQPLLNGFAYYDSGANAVIFLDLQLQKTQTIILPEEISGVPVFAEDGSHVYFCVGNEIRAIEVERRLNRLVKTVSADHISLEASHFNGKVVTCTIKNGEKTEIAYISTQTGQTLKTNAKIASIDTNGSSYIVVRNDGLITQRISGKLDGEPKLLSMPDNEMIGVSVLGGAVGYQIDDSGLSLNYYNVDTGIKTAAITIPGTSEIKSMVGDKWGNCIWLLITKEEKCELLRWDMKASAVKDETSYVETLYTAENPDTAALELINERIEALNKKYGVRIRALEEAVKYTDSHEILPEYQAPVINDMLDQLEAVLAEFPKNFVSKSISSKVRICLVKSIDDAVPGVQFWIDNYAFVTIAAGADVRSEFLKGFGFVVDSHVLGNSPIYDYWDDLNPKDFVYGGAADGTLTTGENRAFYDEDSMATGTIDRSRIFWQAMQPDNEDMFKSEIMQAKLKMVCRGIRDAWRLEREEEIYPWEQYLNEPIARKKK